MAGPCSAAPHLGGRTGTALTDGRRLYGSTNPQALPVAANLARGVVARNARHAASGVGGGATQVEARDRGAVVRPMGRGPLPEQLVGGQLAVKDVPLRQAHDRLEIG